MKDSRSTLDNSYDESELTENENKKYIEQLPIKSVREILTLDSGDFIVCSNRDILLFDKNLELITERKNITTHRICDICKIQKNIFAVCSSGDIIILEIIGNMIKILKDITNIHDNNWIASIIYSQNNLIISSCIYDRKINIFNLNSLYLEKIRPIQILNHDADSLLEWDNNTFISSGYSKIRIWDKIREIKYQLRTTIKGIDSFYHNSLIKFDDKFLLIGGLRYETYLINMETMEKNIRIFNKNLTYDIFCFLKSEKYIFIGGEKREEMDIKESMNVNDMKRIGIIPRGYIHIYKYKKDKKGNYKFELVEKVERAEREGIYSLNFLYDGKIISGTKTWILPMNSKN